MGPVGRLRALTYPHNAAIAPIIYDAVITQRNRTL